MLFGLWACLGACGIKEKCFYHVWVTLPTLPSHPTLPLVNRDTGILFPPCFAAVILHFQVIESRQVQCEIYWDYFQKRFCNSALKLNLKCLKWPSLSSITVKPFLIKSCSETEAFKYLPLGDISKTSVNATLRSTSHYKLPLLVVSDPKQPVSGAPCAVISSASWAASVRMRICATCVWLTRASKADRHQRRERKCTQWFISVK